MRLLVVPVTRSNHYNKKKKDNGICSIHKIPLDEETKELNGSKDCANHHLTSVLSRKSTCLNEDKRRDSINDKGKNIGRNISEISHSLPLDAEKIHDNSFTPPSLRLGLHSCAEVYEKELSQAHSNDEKTKNEPEMSSCRSRSRSRSRSGSETYSGSETGIPSENSDEEVRQMSAGPQKHSKTPKKNPSSQT